MSRGALAALALLALLGGCGVDGPPVPPSEAAEEDRRSDPGITLSGTASIGIVR